MVLNANGVWNLGERSIVLTQPEAWYVYSINPAVAYFYMIKEVSNIIDFFRNEESDATW